MQEVEKMGKAGEDKENVVKLMKDRLSDNIHLSLPIPNPLMGGRRHGG